MMTPSRILLVCNSQGRMLDLCLSVHEMAGRVWGVASDHHCGALEVAGRHHLRCLLPDPAAAPARFSDNLLSLCGSHGVDYIISTGFTRIFRGEILRVYSGHFFNTHFSLLPAFPGRRGVDRTTETLPPRAIFERALAYGCGIVGNTIHMVDASIDGGRPVMQSSMVVPYDEDPAITRHRLFIQECQCLMQMIVWLSERRLETGSDGHPRVAGARFKAPDFWPTLEERWIRDFAPPLPMG